MTLNQNRLSLQYVSDTSSHSTTTASDDQQYSGLRNPSPANMVLTIEEIEEYLQSIEELLYSSVYFATPDLPNLREVVNRLWDDVSRYGPPGLPTSFPEIPNLGVFEVPPPPPPVVPKSWMDKSADWVRGHPWTTSGLVAGVVGAGLLVGYGVYRTRETRVRKIKAVTRERRQVIGECSNEQARFHR